jgi:haloacid dehalogenase-like hydrolase
VNKPRPLVVDLDGSLIKSDMLVESALEFLHANPLQALQPLLWLRGGKAHVKEQYAQRVAIDPGLLPYEPVVLQLIRQARQEGREVMLATASHHRYAAGIAAHLGLFDRIVATRSDSNLKGGKKAQALIDCYGEGEFDYVGNSLADLPVWSAAHTAYVINPDPTVMMKVRRLGKPVALLQAKHNTFLALMQAMQPGQWIGNLLVFLPLLSSRLSVDIQVVITGLLAFGCLGLCSSSACLLNGLFNIQKHRADAVARTRPIAAGRLPIAMAVLAVPTCLLIAFAVSLLTLPGMFSVCLLCFYLLSLVNKLYLNPPGLVGALGLVVQCALPAVAGAFAYGFDLHV